MTDGEETEERSNQHTKPIKENYNGMVINIEIR